MKVDVRIKTQNVSFERWRELYNGEELSRRIVAGTKVRSRDVIELETLPDGKVKRTIRVVPDVDPPKAVRKLIGGNEIEYHETTVFDPDTRTARLDISSAAGDRVRVGGDVRYVVGESSVAAHFTGEISVQVFGVGRLIEGFIAKEITKRYEAIERLMQELVDEES